MAKKNVVDAGAAVEELKNKKFGLSIQNIIALVTVLSTGIAGCGITPAAASSTPGPGRERGQTASKAQIDGEQNG